MDCEGIFKLYAVFTLWICVFPQLKVTIGHFLVHLHTTETQVVNNAAAQPLIRSHTEDVITAGVKVGLQTGQQTARQQVAVPPVAVSCLLLSANKLLCSAHIQVLTRTEVAHQLRQTICLHVGVILG